MEKLNRQSNLLEVSLNKYDDVLVIDCNDVNVFTKFSNLYERFDKLSQNASEEVKKLKNEYAGNSEEDVNVDEIRAYVDVHIRVSKTIMSELDAVFGNDFTKKAFRENYELNPDFVPDEIALSELIEALTPIMEKAYGDRIKRTKSKYNAAKRGKHTQTKEELIAAYREKNGVNE